MTNRFVALAAIALTTQLSASAATYNFIPYSPSGLANVVVTGINDRGDIVGFANFAPTGPACPFIDRGGQITTVCAFPGLPLSDQVGLNNNDDVVGTYLGHGTGGNFGFLSQNGTYTTIDAGSPATPANTVLTGINDSGQILGNVSIPGPLSLQTYFVDTGGAFVFKSVDIDSYIASGMNNGGNVIGTIVHTVDLAPNFPFYNDQAFPPGSFPFLAQFNAINNNGEIALSPQSGGPSYIIPNAGDLTLSDPISFPGATNTLIRGINNSDTIVGTYTDSSGTHSFVGTLVPPLIEVSLNVDPDLGNGNKNDVLALNSDHPVPFAILGSAQYDIYTFDPASIRLGARGPGAKPVGKPEFRDVDGDGRLDLVLKFSPEDTGIVCADTSVAIKGQTYAGGQAFEGFSSLAALRLEPCPPK